MELTRAEGGTGWSIDIKNFGQFQDTLGSDVLNAFCRCFVHSDRLASMISFAYVSEQSHGRDSVAFGRNLHTMVWFTIGTLRELAFAIRDCRSALKKRGLLDPNHEAWLRLRELEDRWDGDELLRKMRDRGAFHVDRKVIAGGLKELAPLPDVVLCRGEGSKADGTSFTLGLEAMHNGLGINLDEYGRFLEHVSQDHGVGSAIQEALIHAVEKAGIPFGK